MFKRNFSSTHAEKHPTASAGPPAGAAATGASGAHPKDQRLLHRIGGAIRRNPIKSIYAAGLAASITYHLTKPDPPKCTKPKVLVLPFHRMKIVEKQSRSLQGALGSRLQGSGLDPQGPIEIELQELVDLIHHAASDPTIVGLYGIFGHGFGFQTGGWGHVEELRNALRVFRESHRTHLDPNDSHKPLSDPDAKKAMTQKPMYAYADTFANPVGPGTPEYYLASIFTHIQLQPQGDLNLFGLHSSTTFFKDFLKKYGVDVHVFKHGAYKNFANMFSHNKYTKEHRQNVRGIMTELNLHICEGIYNYRNLQQYDFGNFWRQVHKAGSFPGNVAQQIGFVDYVPNIDPLDHLITSNKSDDKREEMKEKLGKTVDVDSFKAEKKISVVEYAKQIKEEKQKEKEKWENYHELKKYIQKHPNMSTLLSAIGYGAPFFNIPKEEFTEAKAKASEEKIAVMKITGGITDATARKVENALRKLKNKDDVKCLVLRVDSPGGSITACETIHQELQDLPQKVVVSFGNVSASGGYYISANADRIYALPTTITGSIGVFMIKLGLEGLAKRYGITFDAVTTSELSGCFDPFFPVNKRMKDNFQNYTDRAYVHFKKLVGEGRNMDIDDVENVAKGRVWTGSQAKELGLVDELGGLQRAIAYAQKTHTETGDATVVAWPPPLTFWQLLEKRRNPKSNDDTDDFDMPSFWHALLSAFESPSPTSNFTLSGMLKGDDYAVGGLKPPSAMSGVMLAMDENTAIRCLLEENHIEDDILSSFPSDFFQ